MCVLYILYMPWRIPEKAVKREIEKCFKIHIHYLFFILHSYYYYFFFKYTVQYPCTDIPAHTKADKICYGNARVIHVVFILKCGPWQITEKNTTNRETDKRGSTEYSTVQRVHQVCSLPYVFSNIEIIQILFIWGTYIIMWRMTASLCHVFLLCGKLKHRMLFIVSRSLLA